MKRTFTHYYLIGGALATYTTTADNIEQAASMLGVDVKGIVAPGYVVIPCDTGLLVENEQLRAELKKCRAAFYKYQAADLAKTQAAAERILNNDSN